ncbi:kisspeptin 2 isoform X2 [Girardinichthys multiradiatus]|uniref:kisspeptin 2 isoform X2 n=1 Tax=Girardinichthys multiradiatus TaxID=208333 RepID=UPI001FAE0734|nr:kisspeptin 2 isoform X2 [Girardinichthys multiradiatus]
MRLAALVVVWVLFVGDNGSVGAAPFGLDSAQKTHATALRRRHAGDFLAEDPNLCLSLKEDEEQRQLLCNDRRSKFNYNPFGLRFGKRYKNYVFRRAVKRARTRSFLPLSFFSRELEVST